MNTVYLYDPVTLLYQGEYVVPKGLHGEDLFPVHYSPNKPADFDPDTQTCTVQMSDLSWLIADKPGPTLKESQDKQTATLSWECQKAIIGGFTSSALGATASYPSGILDQLNQQAAATAGGQLWCSQSDVWALRPHTSAQATQVVADLMVWLNKCQLQLTTLLSQVNAADATIASTQTIVWTNPD